MKKYRVYSGFLDWYVVVEAPNEAMAVVYGKDQMIERLREDASMWALEVPKPEHQRTGADP